MEFYSLLKLLHQGYVWKNEKYLNLLAQNKYYFVPTINVDGLALIEENFQNSSQYMKKRKNMSPNARKSKEGFECLPEDSGVDLNRNYDISFGFGEKTQVGLSQSNTFDDCADPCGECYRGPYAFSEPETRALRDFLFAHKKEIKFVVNFHSYGNQWIYPYNGKADNDIAKRNPQALAVF